MKAAHGGWEVWSVEAGPQGPRKQVRSLPAGGSVQVPAVAGLPAFAVAVREPASPSPAEVSIAADVPLFVLADTHGEYEIMVRLLQAHGVIDDALRWSFGKGRLAVLGDVLDRGAHQTEILWLLYRLEDEAARAGGGVHLLLGNHELMVMSGDVRYLNPKYRRSAQILGVDSYAELLGPQTLLGQWLRAKPAVMKLNDQLLLHGGISRAVVDRGLTLDELNATVRSLLDASSRFGLWVNARTRLVAGPLGPLWYRGYFAGQSDYPAATLDDVKAVLHHFGVRTVLVGHTAVPTVTPLYGGRVIAVQVYPRHDPGTGAFIAEGVLIERGVRFRATIDGRRERLEPAP